MPAPEAPPPADARSAKEHVLEALNFLDRGEPEGARGELDAALRQDPENETASTLLKQLDADPEEMLGRESFAYATQAGDTLSKIAKKFLNDEHKFYVLARYNGIARPRDLAVGQTLRIPGKKPAQTVKPASPPAREAPAPQPRPAKAAEGDPAAEKLYQGGLQALSRGNPEKAYELFGQALKINPRHAGAQDKLRESRAAAVEAHYKKAVGAFRKQDLEGAIQHCDKALEIDPDSERVKILRAQALELNERIKKVPGK